MVAKHMEAYDLCAHLHTKKTIQKDGSTYLGEAWQNELIESLIVSAPDIVNEMTIHEGLGVVIPDIPETFQREEGTVYDREDEIRSHCALLWERMGTTKKLDFDSQPVYVMPYGTMFWYKPKAMTKLTSLHLAIDDIPPEPLREHGTILHAIERLIVYVAWDAGYSYKVVPNQRYVAAFFSNISYNRYFFDRVGTGTKRLDGIRYPELIRYVIKRTGRLLRRLIASPFKGKEKP
jgi:rhamnosyltransferase